MDCCDLAAAFFARWLSADWRIVERHRSRIARKALARTRARSVQVSAYASETSAGKTRRCVVGSAIRGDYEAWLRRLTQAPYKNCGGDCRAFDLFAPALSLLRAARLCRSRPRGSIL